MRCTNCGRPITFENLMVTPVAVNGKIDNISICSKDCAANNCFHHIHICIEEDYDNLPTDDMTLKELLVKERLIAEEIIEITIKVDSNDADYLIETNIICKEDLDQIKPLIEAIKNFEPYEAFWDKEQTHKTTYSHNYPRGEYCPREDMGEKTVEEIYPQFDEEIFEIFEEFCPCGEYGFHTIKAISIQVNPRKEILL